MVKIINNKRYNAERKYQAEIAKRNLKQDEVLKTLYEESRKRVQQQIDNFYFKYASNNGLSAAEARKLADEMDVTKFNDRAREAVRTKDFSQDTNSFLRLYNLKLKTSRLELLKAEIDLETRSLVADANSLFDEARQDTLIREFKRQAGVLGISKTSVPDNIKAILNADFYGTKFSERVWGPQGVYHNLQRDLFGSLNRIYTDMAGYKKERAYLAQRYNVSLSSAQRLLKTEMSRIRSDTELKMLKDNGFTHMIYVAESGACKICAPLDAKAIPINDVSPGVNMYPMHPNCVCSAYGHIKMDYKTGGSTLDREAVNGVWDSKDFPEE